MTNVGQLITLVFKGLTLPPNVKRWIQKKDLGGVFYFPPNSNMASTEEMNELSKEIQSAAPGLPLFIAIDQEGGSVQAWNEPFCEPYPKAQDIGQHYTDTKDPEIVLEFARKIGRGLNSIGVNLDFAPVLDVHTNPDNPIIGDRSFSSDPELVSIIAELFIKGLKEEGVLSCGKHFPGHGDTHVDSHKELPILTHDMSRLNSTELLPFVHNIKAGIDMIMTAHILFQALDPDVPATISKNIIQGLLRDRLKFDGIVITDDMKMKGLSDRYDLMEGSVRAIEAGCDIVLSCTELDKHEELFETLEKAVRDGRISEERIKQSIARIERVKNKWLVKELRDA
jgi:beta-N-acetylhexosaminidase